jgi:hypothetical protein
VGATDVGEWAVMEVRFGGSDGRKETGLQQKQHDEINALFEWLDLDKCKSDIV